MLTWNCRCVKYNEKQQKKEAVMKPKWQMNLTKIEIEHLKDMGCTSFRKACITFKSQALARKTNKIRFPDDHNLIEPCWECREIAIKLGIPV